MKQYSAILLSLSLMSCAEDPKSNPVAENKLDNAVTHRQRLVEQFRTADVAQLPYSGHEFVILDSNGSTWYVNTEIGGSSSPPGGTAMLFAGTQNEWTVPGATPVNLTNIWWITNTIVEDPLK